MRPAPRAPYGRRVQESRQRIGIDVGGSGVKAALVDLTTGAVRGRERVATPQPATPEAVAATVGATIAHLDGANGIGCTLPSVVTAGVVRTAAHLDASWVGVDAHELLTRATGRPCTVLNDADSAGLAETRFGAARDEEGLTLMVTLGTGVGTAVLHGGLLVPNSELGHLDIDGQNADEWVSAATRVAQDLSWKQWAKRLNRYLSRLQELLWPDLIVLGGGIVKRADRFFDRIDPGCEVRIAQLGNDAGIVGAALAAADPSLAQDDAA